MPTPRTETVHPFARLVHRDLGVEAFFNAVDGALNDLVPFDASCWLGLDPATLLPTSHFTREESSDHLMRVAANEFLDEDVNKFSDLARAPVPVALLSAATGGVPSRSKRFREILAPHGYAAGDELRAVFLEHGLAWGCVALHRRHGAFSSAEVAVVADLGARFIGEGIHRAVLRTTLELGAGTEVPGLVVVGADDTVESVTPAAQEILDELVDTTRCGSGLPLVIASLVARIRAASAGSEVAAARVPGRSGGWYQLYGTVLGQELEGRVGVMVQRDTRLGLPLAVAAAYALSPREQEVSTYVLQGCSTREIASDLHLSEYTVQDHLKKVFAKVGVRSRRELVARVFREHYEPRLVGRRER